MYVISIPHVNCSPISDVVRSASWRDVGVKVGDGVPRIEGVPVKANDMLKLVNM
jgi:hypothetical protein